MVLKGEVFISLRIYGRQILYATYHACSHGNHEELFSGDALPYRQSEEGVASLEAGGWSEADGTLCLLIVYILNVWFSLCTSHHDPKYSLQ